MDLSIQKLSKAFNQRIIFQDLSVHIPSGERIAISGSNGSGKSTLLKILSGGLLPTGGRIQYTCLTQTVPEDQVFRFVHFVAPYNTVIEELTLPELFAMHRRLGLLQAFSRYRDWVERLEYTFHPAQPIKMFSSGMKQRVKLAIALLDNRPLILLDEPGSTLDTEGKKWCRELVLHQETGQTIIIASNDEAEIEWCSSVINMESHKNGA